MKAADAKAPKFDSKWWVANKAKGADAGGAFETALKAYEAEKKKFIASIDHVMGAGPNDIKNFAAQLKNLKAAAAKAKADPKLGAMQKETKDALASYEKLSADAMAHIERIQNSPMMKMESPALVKNVPQFEKFCKDSHVPENYNFLNLMMKKPQLERRFYEGFIKPGAKFELNLKGATVAGFQKVEKDIADGAPDTPATWREAPWKDAVEEVTALVDRDVLPRFRRITTGQQIKPKVP